MNPKSSEHDRDLSAMYEEYQNFTAGANVVDYYPKINNKMDVTVLVRTKIEMQL